MNLMKFAEQQKEENYCVAWLEDGKSFVIRHPDEFTRKVLPHFFKATKFSSFTRKLYRWGFRQVNRGIGPDDPIIFGNEFFQRDNAEIMAKMRSITAASARKSEPTTEPVFGAKRQFDAMEAERDSKRMLLDQLIQHKAAALHGHSLFSALGPAPMNMNLSAALRPNLGGNNMGMGMGLGMAGLKSYDMLGQGFPPRINPLLNSFRMQPHAVNQVNNSQRVGQFPTASTADIVNAAINALRFAS
jgi:HSF-type DNA-binding